MSEERTRRVLSVQSHVVSGYVGNKSATFPLQLLGFEVDAINSVQFSNHTGYAGGLRGDVLDSNQLGTLIEGLKANNLHFYDFAVSGYIGSVSFLEKLADVLKELKEKNPDLVYVCDPVMGDTDQGWYVVPELLPVYREKIIPLAKFCVPNQFELEKLTERTISSEADAFEAMKLLHDKGVEVVILSSSEITQEEGFLVCLASSIRDDPENPTKIRIQFPRLDANFVGTGDLFAAVSIAWYHNTGGDLKSTLEKVISTMHSVLKRTLSEARRRVGPDVKLTAGDLELKLIQSRNEISNPEVTFEAVHI